MKCHAIFTTQWYRNDGIAIHVEKIHAAFVVHADFFIRSARVGDSTRANYARGIAESMKGRGVHARNRALYRYASFYTVSISRADWNAKTERWNFETGGGEGGGIYSWISFTRTWMAIDSGRRIVHNYTTQWFVRSSVFLPLFRIVASDIDFSASRAIFPNVVRAPFVHAPILAIKFPPGFRDAITFYAQFRTEEK